MLQQNQPNGGRETNVRVWTSACQGIENNSVPKAVRSVEQSSQDTVHQNLLPPIKSLHIPSARLRTPTDRHLHKDSPMCLKGEYLTTCGGLIGFALECGPGVYPIVIIYPKSAIILDNTYRWFASNVTSPLGIECVTVAASLVPPSKLSLR